MSPIREVYLSLNDVETMIVALEAKYCASSPEFFSSDEIKQRVPEDDIFHWEALIYQRAALREASQVVQSGYLSNLGQASNDVRIEKESQQELLAA
jgi:hypothetical protein